MAKFLDAGLPHSTGPRGKCPNGQVGPEPLALTDEGAGMPPPGGGGCGKGAPGEGCGHLGVSDGGHWAAYLQPAGRLRGAHNTSSCTSLGGWAKLAVHGYSSPVTL